MKTAIRRAWACGALVTMATGLSSSAQEPVTALGRQIRRIDIGISGVGEFTKSTSGINLQGQSLQLQPSNTLGALVTVRYVKSPLVGLEFNYGYARYSENFTYNALNTSGTTSTSLDVQTNVSEYTFGYLVHTPNYFGIQPFAAAGAGTMAFRPSKGGGLGYQPQARAAYYYTVGAEAPVLNEHFGLRVAFRQVFFLAPDFETNYLRNGQRSIASEPTFGFYLHF